MKENDVKNLVALARNMDFDIHDFALINGIECIAKKTWDGDYIYWPIEREGSGFERIFKGFSRNMPLPEEAK